MVKFVLNLHQVHYTITITYRKMHKLMKILYKKRRRRGLNQMVCLFRAVFFMVTLSLLFIEHKIDHFDIWKKRVQIDDMAIFGFYVWMWKNVKHLPFMFECQFSNWFFFGLHQIDTQWKLIENAKSIAKRKETTN